MAERVDLAAEFRGDTIVYDLTFARAGAGAGWMGGGAVWFTAKLSTVDPDSDTILDGSTENGRIAWVNDQAAQPTATLTLGPDAYPDLLLGQTGGVTLQYDVQIRDAAGRVETLQYGEIVILPDVRRAS